MPPELTRRQETLLRKIYYSAEGYRGRDAMYQRVRKAKNPRTGAEESTGISRRQVASWLTKQEVHQKHKPTTYKKSIKPILTKRPFQQMQIDLMDLQKEEDEGNKWILTGVDCFSKMGFAQALKNKSADEVLKGLKRLVKEVKDFIGAYDLEDLKIIQSDNGSEFRNKKVAEFMREQEVKQIFSLPYTPQTQGMVEKFNGTIKGVMKRMLAEKKSAKWTEILRPVIQGYNTTYHETIKKTPLEAVKGGFADTKGKLEDRGAKFWRDHKIEVKKGDKVRIYIEKNRLGKKKKYPNWSDDLYTVVEVAKPRKPFVAPYVKVEDSTGERIKRKYFATQIQPVKQLETSQGRKHM